MKLIYIITDPDGEPIVANESYASAVEKLNAYTKGDTFVSEEEFDTEFAPLISKRTYMGVFNEEEYFDVYHIWLIDYE